MTVQEGGQIGEDTVTAIAGGQVTLSGPAGQRTGYYVRVWRATPQGWRLLVDQLAER